MQHCEQLNLAERPMRVGIIGAGWIATKMARTLANIPSCECYAIAARDLDRAQTFAHTWGCAKAYGSYAQLVDDPDVDLVYVATPHSHHYAHTRLALEAGKPCLVEKAFTANAREAAALVDLARSKGLFLAEALWTRYQPVRAAIQSLLDEGVIGTPQLVTASLCYPMPTKERILRPELCGGALLDLGVYCINFVRMFFPGDWSVMHNHAVLSATGVDMNDSITAVLPSGLVTCLQANALCQGDNAAVIRGTEGRIEIDNVNNPQLVRVFGADRQLIREVSALSLDSQSSDLCPSPALTGYEYEILACREALAAGWTEHPAMPLEETLAVMRLMDRFRHDCGVVFPMD